jgi:predicted nuclease of predicted toxin-antitoxin system
VKIKFLADASLSESIVSGVIRAESSIDFLDANSAALESLSDDEVLAIAARENRILVNHDLKTMPWHFGIFLSSSQSPGVLLLSQKTSVADAIDALLLVWLASEPEEWVNRICRLPL